LKETWGRKLNGSKMADLDGRQVDWKGVR
jgi:hypothetical protein